METKNKIEFDRLKKARQYFWNLKPSEFNASQKLALTKFLELLEPLYEWYEKNAEATPEDAEEIFNT